MHEEKFENRFLEKCHWLGRNVFVWPQPITRTFERQLRWVLIVPSSQEGNKNYGGLALQAAMGQNEKYPLCIFGTVATYGGLKGFLK